MKFMNFLEYYHAVARVQETDAEDRALVQENGILAQNLGKILGFTEMQVAEHIGDENLAVKDLRAKLVEVGDAKGKTLVSGLEAGEPWATIIDQNITSPLDYCLPD